jgi:hypothetical protein
MEEILKLSLADKIIILNEIKRNYSPLKEVWTNKKVEQFEAHVLTELVYHGSMWD